MLKSVAGVAETDLFFQPPELLLDVPHSMGCYEFEKAMDSYDNISFLNLESDVTPASCILACYKTSSEYRYSGKLEIAHLDI